MVYDFKCLKCDKRETKKMTLAEREEYLKIPCECGGEVKSIITNTQKPYWNCKKHTYAGINGH